MYRTEEEILTHVKNLKGRTFGDVDVRNLLEGRDHRGILGHVIEESYFNYKVNPRKGADFEEANIELKVTPVKENKNGTYSAKERLVLNIIDFDSEHKVEFEESEFWKKNQKLLLVFYLFRPDVPKSELAILEAMLYEYPEEDFEIIRQDWENIQQKVREGRAHELSESDTLYLGACPKGYSKQQLRPQPFNDEPAMQRAYALKQSYMTQLVRRHVVGDESDERIIKSADMLKKFSVESYIQDRLSSFVGMPQSTLIERLSIKSTAKNINEVILARMLGVEGRISRTSEFQKANIVPKTIRIEADGSIREHMSFPPFRFKEIIREDWWTSTLREYFLDTRFMFVLFKRNASGELYFQGVKFWSMHVSDLDTHMKKVWERTVDVIGKGRIVSHISGRGIRRTNFPKESENPVGHVRPHARNRDDTYPLPCPDEHTGLEEFTKQCFWFNRGYVKDIISK